MPEEDYEPTEEDPFEMIPDMTEEEWNSGALPPDFPQFSFTPTDCEMSDWSDWGPCNPKSCTENRSRYMKSPPMFGGKECPTDDHQNQTCTNSTACTVAETAQAHQSHSIVAGTRTIVKITISPDAGVIVTPTIDTTTVPTPDNTTTSSNVTKRDVQQPILFRPVLTDDQDAKPTKHTKPNVGRDDKLTNPNVGRDDEPAKHTKPNVGRDDKPANPTKHTKPELDVDQDAKPSFNFGRSVLVNIRTNVHGLKKGKRKV